jgi:tight adherence protein B
LSAFAAALVAGFAVLALPPARCLPPDRRLRALARSDRSAGPRPRRTFAPLIALSRVRYRRRAVAGSRRECAEIVHALAAELRAGRPAASALGVVAGSARWLQEPLLAAAQAVRNGADAATELRRVAAVPGCAPLVAVAAAWSVTERVGGPVADVLDRIGAGLEAEHAHRESIEAALAGPRATTMLLAVLPLLGVALGRSMGADPLGLLLHRPLGWALLTAAGLLETAGLWWMRRITRSAMR